MTASGQRGERLTYEAMGLTGPQGQVRGAIEEGWVEKDGRLPVNASGDFKSKGHPIGATGVSMHVLQAMEPAGTGGRHPGQGRRSLRRLQHGRRRGRELCQHPGAAAVER